MVSISMTLDQEAINEAIYEYIAQKLKGRGLEIDYDIDICFWFVGGDGLTAMRKELQVDVALKGKEELEE